MTTTTKLVENRAQAAEKASVDYDIVEAMVDPNTSSALLAAAAADFAARGLAIVPQFLSRSEIEALREECDALVRARRREDGDEKTADFLIGRAGCVVQTLPRGSRGASAAASGDFVEAAKARRAAPCTRGGAELVFGRKLATLAEALLRKAAEEGEEKEEEEAGADDGDGRGNLAPRYSSPPQPPPLVLIGEQYIVKPARGGPGTAFAWHSDGSWLEAGQSEAGPREPRKREEGEGAATTSTEEEKKTNRQTYLSVWMPLDDVGPGNGGLVLPGEEEIERTAAARRRRRRKALDVDVADENENDEDYSSSIPLVAAAGTAVAMASWLRHASGPNDSERARRAWMPQLKLGAVEVEGEGEEEGEEEGERGDGERRARREKTAAAARETWRVPVPCSSAV